MSELQREGELTTNGIFETKFQRRGLPSTKKIKKRAKTGKKRLYALPSEGLMSSPPTASDRAMVVSAAFRGDYLPNGGK